MSYFALRLNPGDDLYTTLLTFIKENSLSAVTIVSCVGSVTLAFIRFCDAPTGVLCTGPFEIVSLVGTLGLNETAHLHISLGDSQGKTISGHLCNVSTPVHTTAEIVLLSLPSLEFRRSFDERTGYKELVITPK
ncbi:hypothetical protein RCL1_000074 [Eukaryota sp. TZLM3-RCL]